MCTPWMTPSRGCSPSCKSTTPSPDPHPQCVFPLQPAADLASTISKAAGRQTPEPIKPVLSIQPNLCMAQTIALQLGLHMRGAGGTVQKAGCLQAGHLHGVCCF